MGKNILIRFSLPGVERIDANRKRARRLGKNSLIHATLMGVERISQIIAGSVVLLELASSPWDKTATKLLNQ